MAPKGTSMVYGKGKGKGKAKAKLAALKAKLKAAQVAAAEEAAAAAAALAEQPGAGTVAIPAAKPKSKAASFKKKVIGDLGEQSIEEAMAEAKKKMQLADAAVAEAEAMETAQANQAAEAKLQYEKASKGAQDAMAAEMETARAYKAVNAERAEATTKVGAAREELYLAQKKLALLEVINVNHTKWKQIEAKKQEAIKMANDAKQAILEQKAREKEALEATRKLLAEQKAELKGGKGAGKKRKSMHPDEADTLPATLADGSQAADID